MSSLLVDHITELTGQRDRGRLDVALADAVMQLLQPESVVIARVVGDSVDPHWMTRARARRGEVGVAADPAWTAPKDLPALSAHPLRQAALAGQVVIGHEANLLLSVFPLATAGDITGVVEVHTEAPPSDSDKALVAGILRIFRNIENLLDGSERDVLTGLLNRNTFDDTFYKAIENAQTPTGSAMGGRRQPPADGKWWIAMVDIDFFKKVNDNHGHLIGDEVLILMARLMCETLRFQDRLFRFGGEEFVIVMQCPSQAHAGRALERVRAHTEAFTFPQVGRMTVSIGFTQIGVGDSPVTALGRADRAVYHAKAHGRNQVCCHADLVASGHMDAEESVGEIELF